VSTETLNLYSRELCSGFDIEDVRAAARYLARRERADGETAFPALGALLREAREARADRLALAKTQRERQARVELFWNDILPDRMARYGWTETEALERFPEFNGTHKGR
jgi:hypothetical protein